MQTVSLLGGLGVVPNKSLITSGGMLPELVQAVSVTTQPTKGTCSADGQYIFDLTSTGTGFWRRKSADEQCAAQSTISPDVRVHTGENAVPQGGVSVAPSQVLQLGPWTIPVPRPGNAYSWILDDYSKLTPEMAQVISKQLQTPIKEGWKTPYQVGYWEGKALDIQDAKPGAITTYTYAPDAKCYQPGDPCGQTSGITSKECEGRATYACGGMTITYKWPDVAPWGGPWLTHQGWLDLLQIRGKIIDNGYLGGLGDPALCGGRSAYACSTVGSTYDDAIAPIAKFKHPTTGDDWGLYLAFGTVGMQIPSGPGQRSDGTVLPPRQTQSAVIRFTIKKIPEAPWYSGVLKVLFYIPAKIFDLAIATVQEIIDLVCTDPARAQKAAASIGPEATAAVSAAAALCSPKPPGQPPAEEVKINETTGKKAVPWGLIAAGSIAVVGVIAFLLAPPKKKAA